MRTVAIGLLLFGATVSAATFGKVVVIGGEASDLTYDTRRNQVYIANYTGMRIDVLSTADNTLQTPIRVGAPPAAIALSPDNRWLVVATAPAPVGPGLVAGVTVIDLDHANSNSFVPLAASPLAVAFGRGTEAFIVTANGLHLLDPSTYALKSLPGPPIECSKLPVEFATFPSEILRATAGTSYDRNTIIVAAEAGGPGCSATGSSPGDKTVLIRYDVANASLDGSVYSTAPTLGPRVVSVSNDGSSAVVGWGLVDRQGSLLAQFPYPTGAFAAGGHAFDPVRNVIYANVPSNAAGGDPDGPVLHLMDTDNLAVRGRIHIPEPLAGKAVFSPDANTMYAISDSGVTVFPVGSLSKTPQVLAAEEQILFETTSCDSRPVAKTLHVIDKSGQRVPFSIDAPNGVRLSQYSGFTPAAVTVSVDPSFFAGSTNGTVAVPLHISAPTAVNAIPAVRLLLNRKEPDQRGAIYLMPGKLVDLLSDTARNRLYVLRQDTNQVLVLDASSFRQVAALRTGNTPVQMAFDSGRELLLVANDNSQIANVYNLDTLTALAPVVFPGGHYPTSIAASNGAILAVARNVSKWACTAVGGGESQPPAMIDRVFLSASGGNYAAPFTGPSGSGSPACLGIFVNSVPVGTALLPSATGQSIYAAMPNGSLLMYESGYDNYPSARKTGAKSLSGPMSVLSDGLFAVGASLFNRSLTSAGTLPGGANLSAIFSDGSSTVSLLSASSASDAGAIGNYSLINGTISRPVRTVEAPVMASIPTTPPVNQIGETIPVFLRNAATTSDGTKVYLSVSGLTVLPPGFDDPRPAPSISALGNLADGGPAASGALIRIAGSNLAGSAAAASATPLPHSLGEMCATINGYALPLLFAAPDRIDAQLPFEVVGSATVVVTTSGGKSNPFNFTAPATAPAMFHVYSGDLAGTPLVYRAVNNDLVAFSNPVHPKDVLVIVATGLGRTDNPPASGDVAPSDPLARALVSPTVSIGNTALIVSYAGLMPGQVGVYQINAVVPANIPSNPQSTLKISQGNSSVSMPVRVVNP